MEEYTLMKTLVPCRACYQLNRVDLEKSKHAKPICANCKTYLPIHEGVQDVNGNTLKKLITKAELPIAVDFWASWCGPCKMFSPIFIAIAQQMSDRVIFAKFNTEEDANSTNTYKIQSIPTLIIFKNGIEIDRQSGVMQKSSLHEYLSKFAN
jgi:thioredoxin 2